MERLETLKMKRPLAPQETPSPSHKRPSRILHGEPEEHAYASVPLLDRTTEIRQSVKMRTHTARQNILVTPDESDMAVLRDIRQVCTLPGLVSKVLDTASIREEVITALLSEVSMQFDVLCCTEDYGTILSMGIDDTRVSNIAELATEELRKRVPLLYKVLVMSCSASSSKKPWCLFVIYAMLMYNRSQKMNVLQRLMMACSIRYHAENEVNLLILL